MRRWRLILALLAAVFVTGCEIEDVAHWVDRRLVQVRLGVLANAEITWPISTGKLKKAFQYFRQEEVDAVVIAARATMNGFQNQFDVISNVWLEVFGYNAPEPLILEDGVYVVKDFRFAVSASKPRAKPEIVTFYGEGKRALTDELGYYPHDSPVIYAGSLNGIDPTPGFEPLASPKGSKKSPLADASQGLLVNVYPGSIEVRRLDFTQSKPLDKTKYVPGAFYAEDVAPPWKLWSSLNDKVANFWDDTELKVHRGYDHDQVIYTLQWPHLLPRFAGSRAFYYEVTASLANGAAFLRKYVYSPGYHLHESRDSSPLTCVIRESELAVAPSPVTLTVTPITSLGVRGRPCQTRVVLVK